jgi:MFS family permease
MADRYHLIGLSLPRFDTDLALAGLGLGMVIAPLSAAILRIVPPNEHGVASAGVVVARTIGMLIGYASLTVWALHRFHELAAGIDPPQYPIPTTEMPANSTAYQQLLDTYNQAMTVYTAKVNELLLNEYHVIFRATALLCVVAAAVSLAIATRRTAETAVVVEDGAAATA